MLNTNLMVNQPRPSSPSQSSQDLTQSLRVQKAKAVMMKTLQRKRQLLIPKSKRLLHQNLWQRNQLRLSQPLKRHPLKKHQLKRLRLSDHQVPHHLSLTALKTKKKLKQLLLQEIEIIIKTFLKNLRMLNRKKKFKRKKTKKIRRKQRNKRRRLKKRNKKRRKKRLIRKRN